MTISAGLLVVGALLSAVLLRPRRGPAAPVEPEEPARFPTESCTYCAVNAPQQYPRDPA